MYKHIYIFLNCYLIYIQSYLVIASLYDSYYFMNE